MFVCCSYRRRHFESTKLFMGNDHVIDIFTSEDKENSSIRIFSILLSTIIEIKVYPVFILGKRRWIYNYPAVNHGSWSDFWNEIFGWNELYPPS